MVIGESETFDSTDVALLLGQEDVVAARHENQFRASKAWSREKLTLVINEGTGEYARLTRFLPGADTTHFCGKSHDYPEEVFIVSGRLYDRAFDTWLERGHYASRPPGEIHGPTRPIWGVVLAVVSE